MAKLVGPLMSIGASGSILGSLTFSERATCHQVRWQKKQKDVQSLARDIQRSRFLLASDNCRFYGFGEILFGSFIFGTNRPYFDNLALDMPVSGYNECIRDSLKTF